MKMVGTRMTRDQSSPLYRVPLDRRVIKAARGSNSSARETGYGSRISDTSAGLKSTSNVVFRTNQMKMEKKRI